MFTAAVWFGPDQVSSACSVGVFGNQVSNNLLLNINIRHSNKLQNFYYKMNLKLVEIKPLFGLHPHESFTTVKISTFLRVSSTLDLLRVV